MQSRSITHETASSPVFLRLPARLAFLGLTLIVELLVISVWLDAQVLSGRGVLAGLVFSWGAWSVKLGVAVVLGSLIFAESRAKGDLSRISDNCAESGIGWRFIVLHAATMAVFVWLSSILFQQNASGQLPNALVLLWAVVGFVSLALAAVALVPLRIWIELGRFTGDALIYGGAAALAAVALGIFAQRFWEPLSKWTLALVAMILHPFVSGLFVNAPAVSIGTPAFHVEIAPQCSGYEGMGLILAFSSAWLWFFRREWRFPQALLLIPAGIVVMFLANSARIAGLILIGLHGAPQIALGGFHSQAGWIAFNAVAIGFCLIAQRIPALNRREVSKSEVGSNPAASYLAPFLAILAAAMLSRMLSAGFEWFYAIRVIAAGAGLWYFRRSYRDINWRASWIGAADGVLVFAIWMLLEPKAPPAGTPAAFLAASGITRASWIAVRIIGAMVTVPIAEELAFRGFLMRRIESADFESVDWRKFSWVPFLVSSVAFGLMHGDRWLAGTAAGGVFALAQIRRGRIGDAILAHAVANGLIAMMVLVRGDWQLW